MAQPCSLACRHRSGCPRRGPNIRGGSQRDPHRPRVPPGEPPRPGGGVRGDWPRCWHTGLRSQANGGRRVQHTRALTCTQTHTHTTRKRVRTQNDRAQQCAWKKYKYLSPMTLFLHIPWYIFKEFAHLWFRKFHWQYRGLIVSEDFWSWDQICTADDIYTPDQGLEKKNWEISVIFYF